MRRENIIQRRLESVQTLATCALRREDLVKYHELRIEEKTLLWVLNI